MKHILQASQFTQEQISKIFNSVQELKNFNYVPPCFKGKTLGTLFYEPSTRTRWSFEAAMLKLGGQVISMESAGNNSSTKKGESLADTLKTCSQYVDVLVVRHPENGLIDQAAKYSDVPVINAGSGSEEHPTQALIDLYTILQHFSSIDNLNIMFTGDLNYSRTIKSLISLIDHYKPNIWMNPSRNKGFSISSGKSTTFFYDEQIYHQLPQIDILYMTRHQTERNPEKSDFMFKMTYEFAEVMKNSSIIMHPFPRNEEIDPSTDKNKRAVYFEQIKNGLWVRMGLLCYILNCNYE